MSRLASYIISLFLLLAAGLACAQPFNDSWADRIVIPLASLSAGFVDTQTDIGLATVESSDPAVVCKVGDSNQRGNTVWYELTTAAAPVYIALGTGFSYDNSVAVFTGSPGAFVNVVGGCNDDGAGAGSLAARIDGLMLQPNTRYSILVARPSPSMEAVTLSFSAALATLRRVSKFTDSFDGTCDADCSLREAILAGSGAIDLPAGNYQLSLPGSDNLTGDLDVFNRHVYIYGSGASSTTISPAAGFVDRIFDLDPTGTQYGGTFMLRNLTLSGGTTGGSGGCIQLPGNGFAGTPNEYLVLDNVIISGCTAGIGGGAIANPGAPMLIRQSSVINSTSGSGGGGLRYGQVGSNVAVQSVILQSTFSGNTANANFSNGGGGMEVQGNLLLLSSTVYGNRARQSGGGVLVTTSSGRILIDSSTIANNTANYDDDGSNGIGGGLRVEVASSSAYTLGNSVLANNTIGVAVPAAQDCHGTTGAVIQGQGSWIQTNATCVFAETSHTLNQPANLGVLANNGGPTLTASPLANSPLIDRSSALAFCPAADQRALPRPVDGDSNGSAVCDIGAVEVSASDNIFQNGFEGN